MISVGQQVIRDWYKRKNWEQFAFQVEMETAYLNGFSGLLNAPTGSGKTFALFLPFLADYINKYPDTYTKQTNNGPDERPKAFRYRDRIKSYIANLIPLPVIWMAVVFILCGFLLRGTVFGRHVVAIGMVHRTHSG